MTVPMLLTLATGLAAGADGPDSANAKEVARFVGTWRFVSMEMAGKKLPEAAYRDGRLVITPGGKFSAEEGSQPFRGTFKVDVSKSPKWIDVTVLDGPVAGQTARGIYELDGDTYRVCSGQFGQERPTEFAAPAGSQNILQVLHREKGAAAELAGTWQAVTYALDGKEAPAADLQKVRLVIDAGGKSAVTADGKPFLASTIKLDPAKSPKTIDVAFTEGDLKGQTVLGIYKLEGDTLTICRGGPGQPRPTEFASKPGSGHTLMSCTRAKP
jgi:uncharacterized protein (TIGR03067 family)